MKSRKYDKTMNYNGKWVLCKKYHTDSCYISLFIISITDGIVKYVTERYPDQVLYGDVEEYENYDRFFINPIQMENPFLKEVDEGYKSIWTMPYVPRQEGNDNPKINCTPSCPDHCVEWKDRFDDECKDSEQPRCSFGKCKSESCQHLKSGYCTGSILTSYPPQYKRCDFILDIPEFKFCYEV